MVFSCVFEVKRPSFLKLLIGTDFGFNKTAPKTAVMKRILILIFNWLALFTYFLWAAIGITIMGIQRRREVNETLLEFIKEIRNRLQ